ncbi:hypothetical protein WAI453_013265 [Rhynchosporium graminicola]
MDKAARYRTLVDTRTSFQGWVFALVVRHSSGGRKANVEKIRGNQSVVQAPQHQNHAFGEVGAAKRMIAMGNAMLGRRQSSGLPGVVFPQRQTRRSVDEDTECFVVKQEIGVTLHLGVIGLSVEVHAQIPRSRSVPEQKNRARFSILLENIAAQSQLCSITTLGGDLSLTVLMPSANQTRLQST